jgi:hypothetical protein
MSNIIYKILLLREVEGGKGGKGGRGEGRK